MRPLILTLSLLPACILRSVPDDSESSTTTAIASITTTTTVDPLPTSTTTPTATTTDTTDPLPTSTADTAPSTGTDFITKPDGNNGPTIECNGLEQLDPECRPGQKCTIDGALSSTHCVDVVRAPKGLHEPCTVMGDEWSGLDDCDLGMLCWDVDVQGHGICIGLCDGDNIDCDCVDPWSSAAFCQECAVGLCLPMCNPLVQDCPGRDLCLPLGENIFVCVLDASGEAGQLNDPCEFANACDAGLVCVETDQASSACAQDQPSCCQPFCETGANDPCPNPDQECISSIDPMHEIPPGLENLGVCMLPP